RGEFGPVAIGVDFDDHRGVGFVEGEGEGAGGWAGGRAGSALAVPGGSAAAIRPVDAGDDGEVFDGIAGERVDDGAGELGGGLDDKFVFRAGLDGHAAGSSEAGGEDVYEN